MDLGISTKVILIVFTTIVLIALALHWWKKKWEAANPIKSSQTKSSQTKSSQNDANRLLQQIEANTRKTESNTAKTAFWTKVVGVPVLIGLIIGTLAGLTKCN